MDSAERNGRVQAPAQTAWSRACDPQAPRIGPERAEEIRDWLPPRIVAELEGWDSRDNLADHTPAASADPATWLWPDPPRPTIQSASQAIACKACLRGFIPIREHSGAPWEDRTDLSRRCAQRRAGERAYLKSRLAEEAKHLDVLRREKARRPLTAREWRKLNELESLCPCVICGKTPSSRGWRNQWTCAACWKAWDRAGKPVGHMFDAFAKQRRVSQATTGTDQGIQRAPRYNGKDGKRKQWARNYLDAKLAALGIADMSPVSPPFARPSGTILADLDRFRSTLVPARSPDELKADIHSTPAHRRYVSRYGDPEETTMIADAVEITFRGSPEGVARAIRSVAAPDENLSHEISGHDAEIISFPQRRRTSA